MTYHYFVSYSWTTIPLGMKGEGNGSYAFRAPLTHLEEIRDLERVVSAHVAQLDALHEASGTRIIASVRWWTLLRCEE